MEEMARTYATYKAGTWMHLRPDGAFVGEDRFSLALDRKTLALTKGWHEKRFKQAAFVNKTASEIMYLLDGSRTLQDVVCEMQRRHPDAPDEVASMVRAFFAMENGKGLLVLSPVPFEAQGRITGSMDHYCPTQIQVEMTYRCDCRCMHCYVEAGPDRDDGCPDLTADQIVEHLGKLMDNGLQCVELTGGEAFLHPGIWDVLDYLHGKVVIAVLTNGFHLTKNVVNKLSKYNNEMFAVAISLDGPTAEVHDGFRRTPGSFDAVVRAMRLLTEANIFVRAGMSVWSGNYHLIDATIELVRSLDVPMFALSPVVGTGRAGTDTDALSLTPLENRVMWSTVSKNIRRHGPYFMAVRPRTSAGYVDYTRNCGLASKDVGISPTGEVRPCLMFPTALSFGNITQTPLLEIYDKLALIGTLPNTGGEECKGCSAYGSCTPCVIKGLLAYCSMRSKGFDSCKWGKVNDVEGRFRKLGWDMRDMLPSSTGEAATHCAASFAV